jgi:nicotinate-nucleotide adenylyltransferase
MRFIRRAGAPGRLGVLPASFNPPTVAHLALIQAAASHVDEVLCVLPRQFPHKPYFGASLEERLEMLNAVRPPSPPVSIGVSDGGLFIEIARECRDAYGPETALLFIAGRDAAERIVNWDYGEPDAINRMLEHFGLLVASRGGPYTPPPQLADRIFPLAVPPEIDPVSSSQVRTLVASGGPWERLVPPAIATMVQRIYGAR